MASIDEYKKFTASAPQAQREYRTIELFHPDFNDTLRFVQDFVNIDLTLESSAPREASSTVTFKAISLKINEPSENGQVDQILSVDMGAVGNEVNEQLDSITDANVLTQIELIYRKFYSGDLSEPVLVLYLSVSDVSFKDYNNVSFSGEDVDFAVKRSGELYTTERFQGLRKI